MRTNMLLSLIGAFISCSVLAQKEPINTCYFTTLSDTTFCTNLSYGTTGQGYLNKLTYTDLDGNKVELKGMNKVPDVLTFYIRGAFIDKTPLKANKPDGYIRYTERAVDGKLKVYLTQQGYTGGSMRYNPSNSQSAFNHNGWESSGGPSGIYRFYLKMPDGTYYKINSAGNMKKYIKPYLLKCEEFSNQYKGDFSTQEEPFMEMIRLYNSVCE